jgi:hypothetical protein
MAIGATTRHPLVEAALALEPEIRSLRDQIERDGRLLGSDGDHRRTEVFGVDARARPSVRSRVPPEQKREARQVPTVQLDSG